MRRLDYALKSLPDPRGRHFRLLLALSLFVLSIGSWIVVEWLKGDPPVRSNQVRIFSILEIYPTALAVAKEWKPDAYLIHADLLFWPHEPSKALWAAMGFRSPSQPELYLNVYLTEESQGLATESKEGVFQVPRPAGTPIDPAALGLDASEAIEVISRLGGADFLAKNQPTIPQSLILEYERPLSSDGRFAWSVGYGDFASGEQLTIVIDANTGELLRFDDHKD